MIWSVPEYRPALALSIASERMTTIRLAEDVGPLLQKFWVALDLNPPIGAPAMSDVPLD